ncbi:hypothetical protein DEU29_101249 [Idiomarina aquatica]|uniref:Uncharacterized protein n=1 Tax=Idiomarina aquatica TaxID=1327752 RepID=A0A4R6PPP4_9GAMM|nr:hypothetical protein [Idiomarina aquatica]TDP40699.1 hypothetical protein DEU29_101249 [Idiomarina aquatica]
MKLILRVSPEQLSLLRDSVSESILALERLCEEFEGSDDRAHGLIGFEAESKLAAFEHLEQNLLVPTAFEGLA